MKLTRIRQWMLSETASVVLLVAGTMLVYMAFAAPSNFSKDGNAMMQVSMSLATRGTFAVPPEFGSIGTDGRTYSRWYPLLSVLTVPVVWSAMLTASVFHVPMAFVVGFFCVSFNAAISAVNAGLVYFLAKRLGATDRGAYFASLIFAFGSLSFVYSRTFYAEPLLTTVTALALICALSEQRSGWALACVLAGLAFLAKPTGIVVGGVLTLYFLCERNYRWALGMVLGTSAGVTTYFYYNLVRFGNPLMFGQPMGGLQLRTMPAGLAGLLVSPLSGVLWYCPTVLVAIWGFRPVASDKKRKLGAVVLMAAGYLLLHSMWREWMGGWSWGPRFLLPGMPGLFAISAFVSRRSMRVLTVTAALVFVSYCPTLLTNYERSFVEQAEAAEAAGGPWFVPDPWTISSSPIVRIWPASLHQISDAAHNDIRSLMQLRPSYVRFQKIAQSRTLRSLAVWWWFMPLIHVPWQVGLLVSCCVVVLALWLFRRGWKETSRPRFYSFSA